MGLQKKLFLVCLFCFQDNLNFFTATLYSNAIGFVFVSVKGRKLCCVSKANILENCHRNYLIFGFIHDIDGLAGCYCVRTFWKPAFIIIKTFIWNHKCTHVYIGHMLMNVIWNFDKKKEKKNNFNWLICSKYNIQYSLKSEEQNKRRKAFWKINSRKKRKLLSYLSSSLSLSIYLTLLS